MMRKKTFVVALLVLVWGAVLVSGCSSEKKNDPKSTVISLFGAMEKNDQAALTAILDLPELMKNVNEDYSLNSDSARMFTSPEQILEDLTYDGKTKTRWFAYQRIIADTKISGEVASVEVTFVDKKTNTAYLTKFGLHLVNGKWKIFTFKHIP